jgi:hypothetical protein
MNPLICLRSIKLRLKIKRIKELKFLEVIEVVNIFHKSLPFIVRKMDKFIKGQPLIHPNKMA